VISLIFFAGMFVLLWVLLIQPQRRRRAEQSRLHEHLAVGDEVMTLGGLYGRIERIDEDAIRIEIAPGTTVRVAKSAIATRVEPEEAETPVESSASPLP
jgi:preprotein translocase subunit YajC